ncbi:L,D-transpeptidase [Kitasatospora sp. NPDC051170]|uniref:L,D-transpeptidase n=1 Tax=Kitasatospora sp. NPDC051170 TaxID=3364056 RepID=UPI0037B06156
MGPGVVVTGLTLGALAVVSLLAFQANGAQDRAGGPKPVVSASATGGPASAAPSATPTPTAPTLPASSGTGLRVVYSVSGHYVWLIDPKKNPQVAATFPVTPGSVEPTPGSYSVYSRTASGTGTDHKAIEHVVRFAQQNGVVFGFSAAVDGSTPTVDPTGKTGGIRSSRQDAQLLWDFATNGVKVVVVA